METAQIIATVLIALGGGSTLLQLVSAINKRRDGRAAQERIRNGDLIGAARAADKRADEEFEKRRRLQEALAAARVQLIENGITPGENTEVDDMTKPRRARGTREKRDP